MKRVLTIIVLLAAFVSACGLPVDDTPREYSIDEISPQLRPGQLPTPTPEGQAISGDRSDTQIHMLAAGPRLRLVERQKADTADEILSILLSGTSPDETEQGITSAISVRSTGISIFSVNLPFQLVTVDLAPGSLDVRASEQKLALAQIVYSLTSLPEIERVEFVQSDPDNPELDPLPLRVVTDDGRQLAGKQVGREDFALVDPTTGPAVPSFEFATPTPTVVPGFPVTIWKVRQVFLGDDGVEVIGEAGNLEASEIATDARIIGVVRQIPIDTDDETATTEAIVSSLFSGTPAGERNLGLRSAFPPDAFLNSVQIEAFQAQRPDRSGRLAQQDVRIAQVDLATGSLPGEADGKERLLAAAQMVFTLTGLDGIDEVVFSLDGEPLQMPTDNGLSPLFDSNQPQGLTRLDYALEAPGGYLWLPQPPVVATPTPIPEPTATPEA